jgi:hypothetical protein
MNGFKKAGWAISPAKNFMQWITAVSAQVVEERNNFSKALGKSSLRTWDVTGLRSRCH